MLHSQLRKIEFKEEWNMVPSCPALWKRSWSAITGKCSGPGIISGPSAKKTEFELCVIGSYQMFYDQALEAVQGIRELWPGADELRQRAPDRIIPGNA